MRYIFIILSTILIGTWALNEAKADIYDILKIKDYKGFKIEEIDTAEFEWSYTKEFNEGMSIEFKNEDFDTDSFSVKFGWTF